MISRFKILPDEYFWGGATVFGTDMPITIGSSYCRDFRVNPRNQMMPLFLSSKRSLEAVLSTRGLCAIRSSGK